MLLIDGCKGVGAFIGSMEWLTFVCLHTRGAAWKTEFDGAPSWVKKVMEKGG